MNRFFAARITVATVLVSAAISCKKKPVAPPPPPPVIVLPKAEPPKQPPLPPAPKVETTPPESPSIPEVKPGPPPPRKKASTPRKKASAPKKTVVEPPKVEAVPATEPASVPPPVAAPKFGQILTPDQVKDFTKRLDAASDRVRNALVIIQGKNLNDEQKETMGRIRAFLTQAEQARGQDLQSAVSLAERADLLSRDLLDRLR